MATAEQKGKRPKIDEDGDERMDDAVLISIEQLQEIQDEIEKVNEEASDKVLEVEQKYNEVRRPVYARRNEIIREIPDFWLTAFLSHPILGELLTEDDQKIFKHLESIDVDEFQDIKSGYSITMTFSSNQYFEDTKLTKTLSFSDDGNITVKATSIKWKDRMDIANGKAYTKDGFKRLLIDESFFTWFSDAKNKSFSQGVIDEVADIIKEELWPNPMKYFNNEDEEEFEDEEEQEESDEEEDDDDDEDEEREEDEEE
ncbi:NAP1-related protein 1 [Lolium perenne]|uniref:NAP1-related protein 1 n=1 Tax=Lolium perenne TaxID=4522 RepID=UPI0021F636E3|nr:NAP1-related protein 1-like [Lolium perenne]